MDKIEQEIDEENCINTKFNENFVDQTRDFVRYTAMTLIILAIILDVVCFKYREKADFIIYIELILGVLNGFSPSNDNYTAKFYVAQVHVLILVMYYTDVGKQLVAIIIRYFMIVFIIKPVVYMEEFSLFYVLTETIYIIGVFCLN